MVVCYCELHHEGFPRVEDVGHLLVMVPVRGLPDGPEVPDDGTVAVGAPVPGEADLPSHPRGEGAGIQARKTLKDRDDRHRGIIDPGSERAFVVGPVRFPDVPGRVRHDQEGVPSGGEKQIIKGPEGILEPPHIQHQGCHIPGPGVQGDVHPRGRGFSRVGEGDIQHEGCISVRNPGNQAVIGDGEVGQGEDAEGALHAIVGGLLLETPGGEMDRDVIGSRGRSLPRPAQDDGFTGVKEGIGGSQGAGVVCGS